MSLHASKVLNEAVIAGIGYTDGWTGDPKPVHLFRIWSWDQIRLYRKSRLYGVCVRYRSGMKKLRKAQCNLVRTSNGYF